MSSIFWRLLADVRAEERARFGFFAGLAALVSGAQTLGLAGAESLVLSRLGAGVLPLLFVVASAVTVSATLLYAGVVGRARNDRLQGTLLLIFAGVVAAGFWALGAGVGAWVPVALLCGWFATQAILLNHFQTFANDYFDTLASKRLVPLFTLGASAGGALGGAAAAGLARLGAELLIAGWAALLALGALWVVTFARPLGRWRTLGFEEADETSVQGIVASLRYARRSRLSRWLVASVLAMVIALFVSQYLYLRIFSEAFPDPSELAWFIAVFLAVSNAVELGLELWLTPWLIRRFGVASANLVHAGATVATFALLAVDRRLAPAVVARLNREMVENAVAAPVRNLVYNALPLRLRGRMRAFLEGILHFSAMSVAGGLLLAVGEPDLLWLCVLGGAAALLYLVANLRVRGAYLDALLEQLREGRLDLASVEAGLGDAEVERLGALWSELLRAGGSAAASATELAPLLAARGVLAPLLEGAVHPEAGVRCACVRALGTCDTPAAEATLAAAMDDPDPEVRLAALGALGDEVGAGALRARLVDPDPRVRAQAAVRCGAGGADTLRALLADDDPAPVIAALGVLPRDLRDGALARLDDRDPRVRAAALARFAAWAHPGDLPRESLERALADPSAAVRREAVRATDALLGNEACAALARALDDPDRGVRTAAAEALGRRGDLGVEAAEGQLQGGPWTADAALAVLGRVDSPRARQTLRGELRARVTAAWESQLALHALSEESDAATRYLRAAHGDALARNVGLALRTLRHLEGADVLAGITRALRLGSRRARSDALETLSNLGERAWSSRLALLLEPGPLEERLPAAGVLGTLPPGPRAVFERARHSQDRWVRMAVTEALGRHAGEERMERLLALKQVPLFSRLSLDQLESVNRIMTVEQFARGDVVVREGERGNRLYLVLEGEVEVWGGYETPAAVLLNRMPAVAAFGEMAVLHEQTRTATVVTAEDSLLASLDGDRMKELILRMPEISFVIFGQLVERARRAEERLRELHRTEAP